MTDDPLAAMTAMVAAGVTEMIDAVGAVLAGLDAAGQAAVAAFSAALTNPTGDEYRGTSEPEDASFIPANWAAYSHEELYQMLRDEADVGDVSDIAAEWGRHAEALTSHADAVRRQRDVLTANWQGESADRAAETIEGLARLIDAIAARASRVRQAAQDSADALARARNTMPAPPGQPALTSASGSGGTSGGAVVFAVGAVSIGGTSMFDASVRADSAKSRAEEVMRGYESSLHGSGTLIAPPVTPATGGTDPSGAPAPDSPDPAATRTSGFTPGEAGPPASTGPLTWSRLTRGGVPGVGQALGTPPLPPGAGAGGPVPSTPPAPGRGPAGTGGAGYSPLALLASGPAEDKRHRRRQPDVVKGLFDDDRTASKPVIGE